MFGYESIKTSDKRLRDILADGIEPKNRDERCGPLSMRRLIPEIGASLAFRGISPNQQNLRHISNFGADTPTGGQFIN